VCADKLCTPLSLDGGYLPVGYTGVLWGPPFSGGYIVVEQSGAGSSAASTDGFVHPFSPAGRGDPHGCFRWLRRNSPVFYDRMSNMWFLTRYADCFTALREAGFSAAEGQRSRARDDELPPSMLTTDGADHNRLRAPGSVFLGSSAMREHKNAIVGEVAEILDWAGDRSKVDAVSELGAEYAVGVLARVLELPSADRAYFGDLARRVSVNLDPLAGPEMIAQAAQATTELNTYFHDHIAAFPAGNADTPVRRLAQDGRLTRAEVVGIFTLCVIGGYEPLGNGVANTLAWILADPELVRRLSYADPEDIASAVEEGLRLDAPIPFVARAATKDVTLSGTVVPEGGRVLAILASANRDPDFVADPDRFLLGRARNQSLSFGGGVHFCLGAPLVRLAMARLLGSLLKRFGRVRVADPALLESPPWRQSIIPRGLDSLPIVLR
jgi:pimeloyl-[acyl-carrier protein] synthase